MTNYLSISYAQFLAYYYIYFESNLTPRIVFIKFNVKFDIILENSFHDQVLNFSIDTQICHRIKDPIATV